MLISCSFLPHACTSFYRIKKVYFLSFLYPLPLMEPPYERWIGDNAGIEWPGCECWVCLFQVPAPAADPQSLNQPHSPGNPHSLPHMRNGIKNYCLNIMLLLLAQVSTGTFLPQILRCKKEDLYIRKLVIYRVTLRLHTALQ